VIRRSRALRRPFEVPRALRDSSPLITTDEHVVVTSGALRVRWGCADKRSSTNTKLTVGGFVDASANVNHFAFTRDEEDHHRAYGEGPVEFNYVNPNDDPRNHPNASRQQ
jgi:hypothetical protein